MKFSVIKCSDALTTSPPLALFVVVPSVVYEAESAMLPYDAVEAEDDANRPCECEVRCAEAGSDTPHGSHGFNCSVIYTAAVKKAMAKAKE